MERQPSAPLLPCTKTGWQNGFLAGLVFSLECEANAVMLYAPLRMKNRYEEIFSSYRFSILHFMYFALDVYSSMEAPSVKSFWIVVMREVIFSISISPLSIAVTIMSRYSTIASQPDLNFS